LERVNVNRLKPHYPALLEARIPSGEGERALTSAEEPSNTEQQPESMTVAPQTSVQSSTDGVPIQQTPKRILRPRLRNRTQNTDTNPQNDMSTDSSTVVSTTDDMNTGKSPHDAAQTTVVPARRYNLRPRNRAPERPLKGENSVIKGIKRDRKKVADRMICFYQK
jgi:hypothetical protein